MDAIHLKRKGKRSCYKSNSRTVAHLFRICKMHYRLRTARTVWHGDSSIDKDSLERFLVHRPKGIEPTTGSVLWCFNQLFPFRLKYFSTDVQGRIPLFLFLITDRSNFLSEFRQRQDSRRQVLGSQARICPLRSLALLLF